MTLPTEDVAALVARLRDGLEGVPPGPWAYSPWHEEEGPAAVRVPDGWVLCATAADSHAAHIALCSPDNIRALLDHIAAQEAALSTLAGERDTACENHANATIGWERERGLREAAEARATTAEAQVVAMREASEHESQWRKLALQFDRHRIAAMTLIRSVAQGHVGPTECAQFAAAPPPPADAADDVRCTPETLQPAHTALRAGTPPSGAETQEKAS